VIIMAFMVLLALAAGFILGVAVTLFALYCIGVYAEW